MSDFVRGLSFWWRGWKFIFQNRSLLPLALAPLTIALVLLGVVLYYAFSNMSGWLQYLIGTWLGQGDSWWMATIHWVLIIFSSLLISVGLTYLAYIVQALIAIPFFTLLADKVLLRLGAKVHAPQKMREWIAFNLRMFRVGLVKTVLFLIFAVFLFGLSFVPGLNLLSLFGTLLILSFDCMDYSFEGMGWRFRDRLGFQRRNGVQWMGAAVGLGLTLVIPGLTLLVVPGAVVGGALLVHESRSST